MKKKKLKVKVDKKIKKTRDKKSKYTLDFLGPELKQKEIPSRYSFEPPKLGPEEKVSFPKKEFKEEIKIQPKIVEPPKTPEVKTQVTPAVQQPQIKVEQKQDTKKEIKAEQSRTALVHPVTETKKEIKVEPKKEEKKEVKEETKEHHKRSIASLIMPLLLLIIFGVLYYLKYLQLIYAIIFFGVALIIFDMFFIITKKAREKHHLKEQQKYQLVDIGQIKLRPLNENETDFDLLLELIEKNNALSVSQIAVIFKITKEKAEEWGRILEENGFITVFYPVFSEPQLRKKS